MSDSNRDPIFVEGMFIKDRSERTPDYILASFALKVEKFKQWLEDNEKHNNNGWLTIDIKLSQKGTKYAELNTWKKEEAAPADPVAQAQQVFPDAVEEQPVSPPQDVNVADIPF